MCCRASTGCNESVAGSLAQADELNRFASMRRDSNTSSYTTLQDGGGSGISTDMLLSMDPTGSANRVRCEFFLLFLKLVCDTSPQY